METGRPQGWPLKAFLRPRACLCPRRRGTREPSQFGPAKPDPPLSLPGEPEGQPSPNCPGPTRPDPELLPGPEPRLSMPGNPHRQRPTPNGPRAPRELTPTPTPSPLFTPLSYTASRWPGTGSDSRLLWGVSGAAPSPGTKLLHSLPPNLCPKVTFTGRSAPAHPCPHLLPIHTLITLQPAAGLPGVDCLL